MQKRGEFTKLVKFILVSIFAVLMLIVVKNVMCKLGAWRWLC